MAKLKTDPIQEEDLDEYLRSKSDFAFELQCLQMLNGLGFDCQHSGFYKDPATEKQRQFDIRASFRIGPLQVSCAIECKNLQPHCPLLLSCVPRTFDEHYHDLCISVTPQSKLAGPLPSCVAKVYGALLHICGKTKLQPSIAYGVGDPVAKETAQVGRNEHDGSISSRDEEIFDKWTQALASIQDLADAATREALDQRIPYAATLLLPIVVVPDGALWEVLFYEDGRRGGSPVLTERRPFFVGRPYTAGQVGRAGYYTTYNVSHLEFVTVSGMIHLLSEIMYEMQNPNYKVWFPMD